MTQFNEIKDLKIGLHFKPTGRKTKDVPMHKIVDILKTYNSLGELVKTRYLVEYYFMNKMSVEMTATEIQRHIYNNGIYTPEGVLQ